MADKPEEETKDVEMEEAAPDAKTDETNGDKAEAADEAAEAEKSETPKEPEKPKELEEDDAEDKRQKVKDGSVALNFADSTLNVMPTSNGKLLMTLTEGGMQYLLASVRAGAGLKAGRYMFEVKIVESLNPSETPSKDARTPLPRQLVRLGFSLAGSSLFLSDGADNVSFDSEGYFLHDKNRKKMAAKVIRDQTMAVLLNLDASSPNANTISLFHNGKRVSQPQPLPENLKGKALYPTITYKNVTVHVNLGPEPRHPLPFKCRMIGAAAAADVEFAKSPAPVSGKPEVVFPVGLPDHGYFDWVDAFLESHPDYVELSDRKLLEWASKSGLWRSKATSGSNDKPDMRFGIPQMDDLSARKVIKAIAPTLKRNYIVPEIKSNLLENDRTVALSNFAGSEFVRKAAVFLGEPSAEYKKKVQSLLLADKVAKADVEKKKKAQEAERKRLLEEKKKKAEEARKVKEAAQRKKEGKGDEEAKADEAEESKEEAKMEVEEAETPIELTDEEKQLTFRKSALADLSEKDLSSSYASFSIPMKAEGFDDITFSWQKEAECAKALQSWILEKKLTQRAEDLQPGASFKELWAKFQKTLQEWRRRAADWKDPTRRKAFFAKKLAAAKKEREEQKKALIDSGDEEGAKALDEKPFEGTEPVDINVEELDVFAVEDVTDIGNGEPLFYNFLPEDWTLLATRYELHLLLHSFKKDLNDADRPSFSEKHLGFYYNKYFKKSWNFQQFGLPKFEDFIDLIKDTVSVEGSANKFLKAEQSEETPIETFVKLTEDHRRERQRRIDAGDETAKLKFTRAAATRQDAPPGRPSTPATQGGKGGYGKSPSAPPRYSSSSGPGYKPAPSGNSGGYSGASTSSYGAQKRPYSASAPQGGYGAPKQPRTAYGGSSYSGGGGGSNYYTRR